jgi:hypothetical protein
VFDFWQRQEIFVLSTALEPALGPTQPPIQWIPEALSRGIKRPGRENNLPPSSDEDMNTWSYTSSKPFVFIARRLTKHKDKFAFLVLLGMSINYKTDGHGLCYPEEGNNSFV